MVLDLLELPRLDFPLRDVVFRWDDDLARLFFERDEVLPRERVPEDDLVFFLWAIFYQGIRVSLYRFEYLTGRKQLISRLGL